MSRKIPALLSILVHLNKGGRNGFTTRSKKEVICRQKGKCALCGGKMNRWEGISIIKMAIVQTINCQIVELHTHDVTEKSMQEKLAKDKINQYKDGG
jgi:hypothetical protein